IWDGVDLEVGRAYARAFAGVAELSTYITGEQGNARGAEAMGMLPRSGPGYEATEPGLDAAAMFEQARAGNLAVLSIFGGNPARNAPDPATVAAALREIPFLVVSELFATETADLATLVLPARGAYEKSGTTIGLGGDLLPVNASLQPPDGTLADFEMIAGLAGQFDIALPRAEEIDRTAIAYAARAPEPFTFGDERFASSVATAPSQPVASRILSGGGTWQHDPWLNGLRT
ncbi:MAG: molybdopterin-dependent oxidoreductase, partial [Candidatus Baltobacteraceae bacterium]